MKTLIAALTLVLLGSLAQAQENYTIAGTAGQVTDLADGIVATNIKTCKRLVPGTPVGCTQAAACTAANAAGGASCTAAQARAANARIWIGTTQAGREEFVTFVFVAPHFQDLKATVAPAAQYQACLKWQTDNTTAKNSSCTAAGLAAGCTLYGTTCQ